MDHLRRGLDLALEIGMDEFAVAIATFHIASVARDLQPHARMPQGTFAPVTGNTVRRHDLGLWRILAHGSVLGCGAMIVGRFGRVMPKAIERDKSPL